MRKIQSCILISCLLFGCKDDNILQLAIVYKKAETSSGIQGIRALLADDVQVFYGTSKSEETKESIILNHQFSIPLQPANRIISAEIKAPNTVALYVSETNKLIRYAGVDSIHYKYTYTFERERIKSIQVDTLIDARYSYRKFDSLYNEKLTDLLSWIRISFPEETQKLDSLNERTGEL